MRADAVRNRARLLEAADQMFTHRGTSASTDEVARAAGVGIGTLFRHFPTKEALLEAVLVARLEKVVARANELSQLDDAGKAFRAFFTEVAGTGADKKPLTDALTQAGVDVAGVTQGPGKELRQALRTLLDRAQRSGDIREDVRVPDLLALLIGATKALEQVGPEKAARRRVITVLLDGLRATD